MRQHLPHLSQSAESQGAANHHVRLNSERLTAQTWFAIWQIACFNDVGGNHAIPDAFPQGPVFAGPHPKEFVHGRAPTWTFIDTGRVVAQPGSCRVESPPSPGEENPRERCARQEARYSS
jgi:hypothetical protein